MALRSVTAKKITTPDQKVTFDDAAGKELTFDDTGAKYFSVNGGADTLVITSDNWQYIIQEDYADVATDLSATDVTGS